MNFLDDEKKKVNLNSVFFGDYLNKKGNLDLLSLYKKNGFVTGTTTDSCSKKIPFIKKGFIYENYDHENIAVFCDPNFFNLKDPFSLEKGITSLYERCLYGKSVSSYMIDYATQFWEKYKENNKFFTMNFNYGNEPTGSAVNNLDEPLEQFLQYFYRRGLFKNTALLILSDHGNFNGLLYDNLEKSEFENEKYLGTFFLLLSNTEKLKRNDKMRRNLYLNQQKVVTPLDVYETLRQNLSVKGSESKTVGMSSVFDYIDDGREICRYYNNYRPFCFHEKIFRRS